MCSIKVQCKSVRHLLLGWRTTLNHPTITVLLSMVLCVLLVDISHWWICRPPPACLHDDYLFICFTRNTGPKACSIEALFTFFLLMASKECLRHVLKMLAITLNSSIKLSRLGVIVEWTQWGSNLFMSNERQYNGEGEKAFIWNW